MFNNISPRGLKHAIMTLTRLHRRFCNRFCCRHEVTISANNQFTIYNLVEHTEFGRHFLRVWVFCEQYLLPSFDASKHTAIL